MPFVSTRHTVFLMHTDDLATFGANPSFLVVFNEIPYAKRFYMFEIFNHTHSIPGSITMVQAVQRETGKAVTMEAIWRLRPHEQKRRPGHLEPFA